MASPNVLYSITFYFRVRSCKIRLILLEFQLYKCSTTRTNLNQYFCSRSFNYKNFAASYSDDRDNCELSDRDSRDMDIGNSVYYDTTSEYDFYERNNARLGTDGECLDGK